MATETELNILAREALFLMKREGATREIAKQVALNAHKDIKWTEGIMRAIGERMSEIQKAEGQKEVSATKSAKPFATFAERSIPKNDK